MKPVGSLVHLRHGTVNLRLVGWLCAGSVPSAFCGVLIARALGDGSRSPERHLQGHGRRALLAGRRGLADPRLHGDEVDRASRRYRPAHRRARLARVGGAPAIVVRPVPTVLVGIVGGLCVGMTSVGSGSLIIVTLLALYPALKANQLVGTDLMQAVPLVWAAALGHILFGDFKLEVTAALLAGSIPGVYHRIPDLARARRAA